MDAFPRRIQLEKNTTAELAIRKAMEEVEKVGADVKLTDSIVYLHKALDKLSDYVDEQLEKEL